MERLNKIDRIASPRFNKFYRKFVSEISLSRNVTNFILLYFYHKFYYLSRRAESVALQLRIFKKAAIKGLS